MPDSASSTTLTLPSWACCKRVLSNKCLGTLFSFPYSVSCASLPAAALMLVAVPKTVEVAKSYTVLMHNACMAEGALAVLVAIMCLLLSQLVCRLVLLASCAV